MYRVCIRLRIVEEQPSSATGPKVIKFGGMVAARQKAGNLACHHLSNSLIAVSLSKDGLFCRLQRPLRCWGMEMFVPVVVGR